MLARIRRLAIPPAWQDVWICPLEHGHLQAVGRDVRGRKQYRYHPRWRAVRDETKYWRMASFGRVLPRHLEIVYEINARFLDEVRLRTLGNEARVAELSLIDERGERSVRMAHLACVGSHAINGVAKLHTELLKSNVLKGFYELWPERFSNQTNGVTPRRWLALANPRLAELLTATLGDEWARDLERLEGLDHAAGDAGFRERWNAIKRANKEDLVARIAQHEERPVDPASLFDVQVKRIHEYKRQHLNVLHIVTLYERLRREPGADVPPRTFIFGGKAAPGYDMAKLIIRLIHGVAEVVNADPATRDRLRVVFIPDFNVTVGHRIYPAADLSEQISTAGKEASGTGNMKFMLNGAVTIGTLDGANVEIREEVGADNFFVFGLTAEGVERVKRENRPPQHYLDRSAELRDALELVASGHFSRGDRELFRPLVDDLRRSDPFLVLADYDDYVACQERVADAWRDATRWARMSILNTARSCRFSSDRAIREYCERIWHTAPVPVTLR